MFNVPARPARGRVTGFDSQSVVKLAKLHEMLEVKVDAARGDA